MRIREPKTTALIFASGKMVVTGAKSEDDSKLASRKYARIIQKLGFNAKFTDFKIQNIVGPEAKSRITAVVIRPTSEIMMMRFGPTRSSIAPPANAPTAATRFAVSSVKSGAPRSMRSRFSSTGHLLIRSRIFVLTRTINQLQGYIFYKTLRGYRQLAIALIAGASSRST